MSCDHELSNEWARCSGKNASYLAYFTCQNSKLCWLLVRHRRQLQIGLSDFPIHQNSREFRAMVREKGPGLLINSMLKKRIQTEFTIVPPTEVHKRAWTFLRVLPARCSTRFAHDAAAWSPTQRSDCA